MQLRLIQIDIWAPYYLSELSINSHWPREAPYVEHMLRGYRK
jgi:hypothetical protein